MSVIISDIKEIESKEATLTKIKTDSINWTIYYENKQTGEKWVKEYPDSSYHGGGAPQLRKIEKFDWE
jgi:hypothetical protein